MANPTTYFGWVMPNSADLVTDLPADFAVFGQGVDTSMQYLLGGTTGQVLSKTSGTNMAFTWVTPTDQVPLTTKGDLFTFTTVDARLGVGSNNQTLYADSTAGTGLAWGASAKSTLTTTGDILYASAANTPARLGIGSSAQILSVSGGIPAWTTPVASGAYTLLSTTTLSSSNQVISSIDQTYKHLFVTIQNMTNATGNGGLRIDANSNASSAYYTRIGGDNATFSSGATQAGQLSLTSANLILRTSTQNQTTIMYYNYAEANLHPFQVIETYQNDTTNYTYGAAFGTIAFGTAAAISSIRFNNYGGAFTAGTVKIYGVN